MRFVDDPMAEPAVKAFLAAAEQGAPLPPLYATLKHDFCGRKKGGDAIKLLKGQRVRVTDVGRFGEIGVTSDLGEAKCNEARVAWGEVTDYSAKP